MYRNSVILLFSSYFVILLFSRESKEFLENAEIESLRVSKWFRMFRVFKAS